LTAFSAPGIALQPDTAHGAWSPQGGGTPPADAAAQNDAALDGPRLPPAGVLDELSGALASARAALSNFLDLISLEARRASLALTWMIVSGLVAAVCIFGAWLGLMAALAMWAVSLGVPPIAAVVAVAMINLIAAVASIGICIGMSRGLMFSATRRQFAGNFTDASPAP
jgi:hypothetical protein